MAEPAHDFLPKSITDEAARWVAASEGGTLSAEDEALFEAWLATDTRHRRALAQMQEVWAHMGAVAETPSLRAALPSRPSLSRRRTAWRAAVPHRRVWAGPALAASLVLAFIGLSDDWATRLHADAMTATGERRTVGLPDGSSVELDTHTTIAVDFGPGRRVVRLLTGEAAFAVARDPRRPFTVETAEGTATALGTRFLVRSEAQGARVTVTEHRVRVAYPPRRGSVAVVGEGESVAYGPHGLGRATRVNTDDAMAWTQGMLVFKDRPLAEVVAEIGRYHRGYFGVLGSDKALRVSGVFRIDDPVAAIDQFERSLGLHSFRLSNRLILISS